MYGHQRRTYIAQWLQHRVYLRNIGRLEHHFLLSDRLLSHRCPGLLSHRCPGLLSNRCPGLPGLLSHRSSGLLSHRSSGLLSHRLLLLLCRIRDPADGVR